MVNPRVREDFSILPKDFCIQTRAKPVLLERFLAQKGFEKRNA